MSKVKDGNYIVIQSFMVKDMQLKGNELLVYAIIYGFSQEENQAFNGSLQYLADWTNSTKQGVLKNLKSLVEKGFLTKSETTLNGVKFCSYRATEFNGALNKVEYPIKQSLTEGIKQSLTNKQDIDKQEDKKNNITPSQIGKEFDSLWNAYPNKKGKKAALTAYERARKKGVAFQTVLDGVYAYAAYITRNKIAPKYIKQGDTFFRNECWDDDYKSNVGVNGIALTVERDTELDAIF